MAKDPTTSLENRMNSVLLRLRREGRLSGKTYYHLHSSAAGVPRLYGLPKVHKPDVPLRPIVSFVPSPTYALSKFLASLLSPIVRLSDSQVRNSQQFAQFITTHNVPDSEVLVSFDAVSLFTHVPTSQAIQVTRDRLMNDPSLLDRTSLTMDDICSLLQLCLEATYSYHPAAHKRAVVRTQMCRAEALSSSGVSRVQVEKLVSQALQGNGYPKGFIHKHTCPQPDQRTPRDQVVRGSVTLPYISGLSESIRRVLAPVAIRVTFRPCRTLRQELVHPKDPVPANRRKGVVYSIPCAECPHTYIGQTGRSLDHRLCEHHRALKNGDLGCSTLAEHVFSASHQVDLSKAMVIDTHNHTQTPCMLESWHIQHHQSPLNREKGTLPGLYAALLT